MFHFTSISEWFSFFVFSLALFRHPILRNMCMIGAGSLIMTEFSYILRDVLHLVKISPAIQIIAAVIVFMILFRVRLLLAALMVSIGYLGVFTIQSILVIGMKKLSLFPSDNILESYTQIYAMSIISAVFTLIVCIILTKYRIGFMYEPERDVSLILSQKLLIIGFFLYSTVLVAATLYLFNRYSIELFVFLGIGIMYYMFGFLLKKEILLASRYSRKME